MLDSDRTTCGDMAADGSDAGGPRVTVVVRETETVGDGLSAFVAYKIDTVVRVWDMRVCRVRCRVHYVWSGRIVL